MKALKVIGIIALVIVVLVGAFMVYNRDPQTEYYGEKYLLRGNHYTLTNRTENYDSAARVYTTQIGTFDGRKELYPDGEEVSDDQTIGIRLAIGEGHCKLIYVTPAGNIQTLVECTGDTSLEGTAQLNIRASDGVGALKLVGYGAKDVALELTFGNTAKT